MTQPKSANDRIAYLRRLNARTVNLQPERVRECKEAVRISYEAASLPPNLSVMAKYVAAEAVGFRSIGVRHLLKANEFTASDYWWGPYFSDVGRAVASGEQKYLQEEIGRLISPQVETISRSDPEFSVLTHQVSLMTANRLKPDILLAPVEVFVEFVKVFQSQMDWVQGHPGLFISGAKLKVFWSHKYAPLNSFMIFSSQAATWRFVPDEETGGSVTMAIGQSEERPDCVEYWVEALANYCIGDPEAFRVIGLAGEPNASK